MLCSRHSSAEIRRHFSGPHGFHHSRSNSNASSTGYLSVVSSLLLGSVYFCLFGLAIFIWQAFVTLFRIWSPSWGNLRAFQPCCSHIFTKRGCKQLVMESSLVLTVMPGLKNDNLYHFTKMQHTALQFYKGVVSFYPSLSICYYEYSEN